MIREQRATVAALGAVIATAAWLALGALTGLGKHQSLAYPLAPVAAITGALIAITPLRRLLWLGGGAVIVFFAVVALTPLTTTALSTAALIRRDAPPSSPPLDGVVVLSGGITADSLLEPEALDRLLTALALMRDGAAGALVVTRARRREDGGVADQDQAHLRALVTRDFPMLTVDSVLTTRDEAVRTWELFRQRGIATPRVAVVTSPLHTRRACAAFEGVGFVVACIPAASRAYSVAHASTAPERVVLFRRWLYERAAWADYKRRGWVKAR